MFLIISSCSVYVLSTLPKVFSIPLDVFGLQFSSAANTVGSRVVIVAHSAAVFHFYETNSEDLLPSR